MKNGMHVVTFMLTTCEPLLLSSLQGDPNSSVSFHYIPGSVIRGALIGRYLQNLSPNKQVDLLEDPHSSRLFFSGETRFLNGYMGQPVSGDGRTDLVRSLPLPQSLRQEKRRQLVDGGWDSSASGYMDSQHHSFGSQDGQTALTRRQHKAISELFGWIDAKGRVHISPATTTILTIHTARHRTAGRANPQYGAVFRYEALAIGQVFAAAILCQSDDDASSIKALLEPDLIWLGRSRSAGYGKTRINMIKTIDISQMDDQTPAVWDETGWIQQQDSQQHTITLLSDLIVRDECGQYSGDIQAWLDTYELTLIPELSTVHTTLMGGFNRTWGLPLPQVQALGQGSTLVVSGDVSRLRTMINAGVGERRAEGFGRFAIDWQPQSDAVGRITLATKQAPLPTDQAQPAADDPSDPSKLLSMADPTSRLVATRILRQRFERYLPELAQRHTITGEISPTQLARLWLVARNSIPNQHFNDIKDLVNGLPANAKRQFRRARVGSSSLYDWLIKLNEKQSSITWSITPLLIDDQSIVENLTIEYTLRLLMTIAKYARKHQQRGTMSSTSYELETAALTKPEEGNA